MTFPNRIVSGNGVATLTAYNADAKDNPIFVVNSNHPAWDRILDGLYNEDPNVWDLFDVGTGTVKRLRSVTERISWNGSEVLWDGDPYPGVLADQLTRAIEQGESNIEALAMFAEKLETNPSDHSKAQAYEFLASHQFQITADGDVVGFKGVQSDGNGGYRSGRKSQALDKPSAYVNGEAVPELSYVPQNVGDVVSMPRAEVRHDPNQHCARGLHVSTYSYAQSFGNGGAVFEVHVNPRDIVSVPNDASGEKVRVCRYTVASITTEGPGDDNVPVVRVGNDWSGDVGYKV